MKLGVKIMRIANNAVAAAVLLIMAGTTVLAAEPAVKSVGRGAPLLADLNLPPANPKPVVAAGADAAAQKAAQEAADRDPWQVGPLRLLQVVPLRQVPVLPRVRVRPPRQPLRPRRFPGSRRCLSQDARLRR
jgi:hypothetical protein